MKRLLFISFLFAALTAAGQGLFTPKANIAKHRYAQQKVRTRAGEAADSKLGAFFIICKSEADPAAVAASLKELGADVKAVIGRQIALAIPLNKADAMADVEGVQLIDIGSRVTRNTDFTRKATQTDVVNDGTGEKLTQAYTGKGVTIALIDAGYDFTHPVFKDKDGKLRIKSVYLPGNSKLKNGYTSDPEVILDTTIVKDTNGSHGIHCASIAAGTHISDVKGLNKMPLGGMAPDADLILCNYEADEETNEKYADEGIYDPSMVLIAQNLEDLIKYKLKNNQPMVTSVSLNSHDGWHDGTSAMARIFEEYCEHGNVTTMATGNEGGDNLYFKKKINANDSLRLVFQKGKENEKYATSYSKSTKKLKMEVGIFDVTNNKELYRLPYKFESDSKDENYKGIDIEFPLSKKDLNDFFPTEEDKKVYNQIISYFESGRMVAYLNEGIAIDDKDNTYNFNLIETYLKYEPKDKSKTAPQLSLIVYLVPTEDTEFHTWGDLATEPFNYSRDGNNEYGNSSVSVGDWCTSDKPINIGAWTASNTARLNAGDEIKDKNATIGNYCSFTSYGTDLAGHSHPFVCAPGYFVNAAYNSFDKSLDKSAYCTWSYSDQFKGQKEARDYKWGFMNGTSMATPCAAGIIALWMQAANDLGKTLTNEDVKDIIAHSSDTDDFTKASPERFGNGKINAYKGLLYVLGLETGIEGLSQQQPENITFRVAGDMLYAEGAENGTPVTIYNLSGAIVRKAEVQGSAVSLSGLQQGVYAVQLGTLGSTLIRK